MPTIQYEGQLTKTPPAAPTFLLISEDGTRRYLDDHGNLVAGPPVQKWTGMVVDLRKAASSKEVSNG